MVAIKCIVTGIFHFILCTTDTSVDFEGTYKLEGQVIQFSDAQA